MATRQAIILNSGFFEELNTSSDKLDLAGNDTDDLVKALVISISQMPAQGD